MIDERGVRAESRARVACAGFAVLVPKPEAIARDNIVYPEYIHNRRVRAYIYKRDQYDRVVAQVFVRRRLLRRDVGLEMLKQGLATVYEAKAGAEFGNFEQQYRDAEEKARERNVGMWTKAPIFGRLRGKKAKEPESPREYKNRHTAAEKQKKTA